MTPADWALIILAAWFGLLAACFIAAGAVRRWFTSAARYQWTEYDDASVEELLSGDADW